MREDNYSTGYSTAPGFLGIKAQRRAPSPLPDRGRRLLAGLPDRPGRAPRRPHPGDGRVIAIASVVLARDFRAEGRRTVSTLGLDGMSPEQLAALDAARSAMRVGSKGMLKTFREGQLGATAPPTTAARRWCCCSRH